MKKLSIVIPIYNVEKYLERCLESVTCQLDESVEVILVNDGSRDNCDQICVKYANKYQNLKYIKQENQGVSAARNKGLGIATGEYISFVDPDDTISDSYIRDILKELVTEPDLLILKYKKVRDNQIEDGPYNAWEEGDMNLNQLKRSISYLFLNEVWNKVFRKKIIVDNNIFFMQSMKIAEDIYFVMDYVDHVQNVKVAKGIYYYYWINTESVSRKSKPEYLENLMKLYQRLLDFSEHNGLQDGSVNQPSDYVMQCIIDLFNMGEYNYTDVAREIRTSEISVRLKSYEAHGIKNKLLRSWIDSISKENNTLTSVIKWILAIYDNIKGGRK